ncbi:MAG: hypothetical protein Q4F17_09320 [Eubacteriales bacterium]|nr:hypothetical protein [Eubacteriales bacterium]
MNAFVHRLFCHALLRKNFFSIFLHLGLDFLFADSCIGNRLIQSAARRQKKKSRRIADTFPCAYSIYGGFDFQSRRFFSP